MDIEIIEKLKRLYRDLGEELDNFQESELPHDIYDRLSGDVNRAIELINNLKRER